MAGNEKTAYREAFLQANANHQFIVGQVEYLLRTLMRGVGAQDCRPIAHKAAEQLPFIIDLVRRADGLDAAEIFYEAMMGVAGDEDDPGSRDAELDVAKAGLMYLVDATAHDNAAAGRAAKRWQNVESAWERLKVRQQARIERWR